MREYQIPQVPSNKGGYLSPALAEGWEILQNTIEEIMQDSKDLSLKITGSIKELFKGNEVEASYYLVFNGDGTYLPLVITDTENGVLADSLEDEIQRIKDNLLPDMSNINRSMAEVRNTAQTYVQIAVKLTDYTFLSETKEGNECHMVIDDGIKIMLASYSAKGNIVITEQLDVDANEFMNQSNEEVLAYVRRKQDQKGTVLLASNPTGILPLDEILSFAVEHFDSTNNQNIHGPFTRWKVPSQEVYEKWTEGLSEN